MILDLRVARSRAEHLFLDIRQQKDLSKKLKECLTLLGEVEPLVSGTTSKRIKEVLVSVPACLISTVWRFPPQN